MLSLDLVGSNRKKVCPECEVLIDDTSDSGWEVLVDRLGLATQPICIWCFNEPDDGIKAPEVSDDGIE